jgi:hypothetical protein
MDGNMQQVMSSRLSSQWSAGWKKKYPAKMKSCADD